VKEGGGERGESDGGIGRIRVRVRGLVRRVDVVLYRVQKLLVLVK